MKRRRPHLDAVERISRFKEVLRQKQGLPQKRKKCDTEQARDAVPRGKIQKQLQTERKHEAIASQWTHVGQYEEYRVSLAEQWKLCAPDVSEDLAYWSLMIPLQNILEQNARELAGSSSVAECSERKQIDDNAEELLEVVRATCEQQSEWMNSPPMDGVHYRSASQLEDSSLFEELVWSSWREH
eukprot:TRINITY_DN823_c0_g1_i5.p1 TRINITY_DN823_c0_g1~~TRINITY_DN823_c0_g1_i5.p1  ORF type:complete len:184 (+),score=16.59 TRINITY_DN823_c0_g1_i5:43-594(+)